MFSKVLLIILALQFSYVFSAPNERRSYSCSLTGEDTSSLMKLPAAFPKPVGDLSYVAVALGTQNYTCSSTGTYTNIGAVAELFDISCLTRIPFLFDRVTDAAISAWKAAPKSVTPQEVISALGMSNTGGIVLGQHYYVPNPALGSNITNPKWDFTSSAGNPDAYIIAAKSFGSAAPTGSQDIDWVFLTNIAEGGVGGKLADRVYRTDTKLGQPPTSSCTPGSEPIQVRYASKYWMMGGSIQKH